MSNTFQTINPATGDVVGVLNFSAITKDLKLKDAESVLNGIAYDSTTKKLFITGKRWPKLFEISLN